MQRQVDHLRTQVKAYEADLLAPVDAPSTGDIAKRVTTQIRYDELLRIESSVAERLDELSGLAQQIANVRGELSQLPAGIPPNDVARLTQVATLMREKLAASQFGSYDVADVGIDEDTLRPSRRGFDVDTDASASDVVRIKVAYLDAIRTVGQGSGHHPGLLILDELRQQDIEPADYAAILRYLSGSTAEGGQTIVTSATPRDELDGLTSSFVEHITDLGDRRLLQPDTATDPLDVD
jgi:hypothetical protein